jgi:GrxC family glutaredoxin
MTTSDTAAGRPLVEIYHKTWCPYCRAALALLDRKGVAYRAIDVTTDRTREREMIERSGRRTVPEIFIGGELVGGFDDLARHDREGTLDELLSGRRVAA